MNIKNLDLQSEKKYIQDIEANVRNLELEKVKLEQQREFAQKAMDESLKKMNELGFSPDTIDDGIDKCYDTITTLKSKINKLLGIKTDDEDLEENEVKENDEYPF